MDWMISTASVLFADYGAELLVMLRLVRVQCPLPASYVRGCSVAKDATRCDDAIHRGFA